MYTPHVLKFRFTAASESQIYKAKEKFGDIFLWLMLEELGLGLGVGLGLELALALGFHCMRSAIRRSHTSFDRF